MLNHQHIPNKSNKETDIQIKNSIFYISTTAEIFKTPREQKRKKKGKKTLIAQLKSNFRVILKQK